MSASAYNSCHDLFLPLLTSPYRLVPQNNHTYTFADTLRQGGVRKFSSEALQQLQNHRIYRWAQSFTDQGKSLKFKILNGFSQNGTIHQDYKGEATQGLFVRDVLHYLFPKATILTTNQYERTDIKIWIQDFAEYPNPLIDLPKVTFLNMVTLKAANPGMVHVDRATLRHQLGLLPDRKVLSLYFADYFEWRSKEVQSLIKELTTRYVFSDVFLSFGTNRITSLDRLESEDLNRGITPFKSDQLQTLSDLTNEAVLPGNTRWIYNDQTGNMPQIHGIADLTVVFGPVNFFESLNMGTRTALYLPMLIDPLYANSAIREMTAKAEYSKGFMHSTSVKSFLSHIHGLINGPEPVPPALVSYNFTSNPFQQMLNDLHHLVERQTR